MLRPLFCGSSPRSMPRTMQKKTGPIRVFFPLQTGKPSAEGISEKPLCCLPLHRHLEEVVDGDWGRKFMVLRFWRLRAVAGGVQITGFRSAECTNFSAQNLRARESSGSWGWREAQWLVLLPQQQEVHRHFMGVWNSSSLRNWTKKLVCWVFHRVFSWVICTIAQTKAQKLIAKLAKKKLANLQKLAPLRKQVCNFKCASKFEKTFNSSFPVFPRMEKNI